MFGLAALVWIVTVSAGQWDKETKVTFSRTVELPGVMLPPGTYVFRLADVPSSRHVVQVFSDDGAHLITTILALPNYRLKPTGDTMMRFNEAKRNKPEAMRAWFYPADNFGQEFVYPRKRAVELAASANVPVLTSDVKPAETPEEMVKEPVVAITPENKEVSAPSVTELPLLARALPTPEPLTVAVPAELPRIASPMPMLVLIGLGSLGMAGALKAILRCIV